MKIFINILRRLLLAIFFVFEWILLGIIAFTLPIQYILTGKTMNEDRLMKKMTDMNNFISPDD